jgi:hypothetical protein
MGDTPGSPADLIWAPICGVSLERYAELSRDMAAHAVAGPDAIEHWVTQRGVTAGAWATVTTGWSSRMVRFAEVRRRYDDLATGDTARRPG